MIAPWDADQPLPVREPGRDRGSLVQRLGEFRSAHPEIKITAAYANPSGKWEVSEPGKAAMAWDDPNEMLDALERRYDGA